MQTYTYSSSTPIQSYAPLATSTSPLSSFRSYLYSEPRIAWLSSPSVAPIYRYLLALTPWEPQHQPKGSM